MMLQPKKFRQEKAVTPDGFSRWVKPNMSKYFLECCDCGLVHEFKFRIVDDAVQFRARRAERYTARQRKARA